MAPQFRFLIHLAVDVGEVTSMGAGPLGERWGSRTGLAVARAERKARKVLLDAYELL